MKAFSPAAERNREPLAAVLATTLPPAGLVLEIAAGSGQHAVHFAARFPEHTWLPTDPDPTALASIRAWRDESGLENLREPLAFDVLEGPWPFPPGEPPAAIVAINMVHISPWRATVALLHGAARTLAPRGVLFLYGPYFLADRPAAPSNVAFDESLRHRDPSWGVRRLEDVIAEAERAGLPLQKVVPMPANNFSVVFKPAAMKTA